MTSQQAVILTRLADRHAQPTSEGRQFAETVEVVVPAGTLPDVLNALADVVDGLDFDTGLSRYSISVSEPFDDEATNCDREEH